jgi:DnaJ family protein A protein 5
MKDTWLKFFMFKERAWYDNHREAILRGGLGEKVEEDGIDLFQYFSTSCYSGTLTQPAWSFSS